jgi:hypothetical protein
MVAVAAVAVTAQRERVDTAKVQEGLTPVIRRPLAKKPANFLFAIELREHGLQFLADSGGLITLLIDGHELLDERGVAHIKQFAEMSQLPALVSESPFRESVDDKGPLRN